MILCFIDCLFLYVGFLHGDSRLQNTFYVLLSGSLSDLQIISPILTVISGTGYNQWIRMRGFS